MNDELAEIDEKILRELERDGRASVAVIAERVHISRAQAYARIKRLTDEGVILGYGVRVDPGKRGLRSSAYVTLNVDQRHWQHIRDAIGRIPEVKHIALVGGEFDVLLLVRARDNQDLRRVVLGELQGIEHVSSSKTLLIFEDHGL